MPGLQSKKRGLSIDEKKQKVLEIFHESKDVFVLKVCTLQATNVHPFECTCRASWPEYEVHLQDIEKLAPKRGVTLQSVKEVVQALVDDDLGELSYLPTMSSSICCMSGCIISSDAILGAAPGLA